MVLKYLDGENFLIPFLLLRLPRAVFPPRGVEARYPSPGQSYQQESMLCLRALSKANGLSLKRARQPVLRWRVRRRRIGSGRGTATGGHVTKGKCSSESFNGLLDVPRGLLDRQRVGDVGGGERKGGKVKDHGPRALLAVDAHGGCQG